MIQFKEIELKYSADSIKLKDFIKLVSSLNPKWQEVSSWDDYFVNIKDDFVRYRHLDKSGQLTIKRKTSDLNNNNRIEVNVNADNNELSTVSTALDLLGFKHNFRIYKACHIAWLDKVDLVYYIVYNEELKEEARFIEIEALENHPYKDEEEAWKTIVEYEKMLEPLGITPQHRLKRSLFEIFKK